MAWFLNSVCLSVQQNDLSHKIKKTLKNTLGIKVKMPLEGVVIIII